MFLILNLRCQLTRTGVLLSLCLFAALVMYANQAHLRLFGPQSSAYTELVGPPADPNKIRQEAITEYLASKYKKEADTVRAYVEFAFEESNKHPDVSPELVLAIIQKESSLNKEAESFYGAQGLMQVVPRFHSDKLGEKESLYDARVNIRVGTQILQEYLSSAGGDLRRALKKYSGGAQGYYDKVVKEQERLQGI